MGIIASWKALYRRKMVLQLMVDFESWQERRDSDKALINGIKDLEEVFDPYMPDAARLVKKRGNVVSFNTVARCWNKSKRFSLGMETDLVAEFGRTRHSNVHISTNFAQLSYKLI